MLRIDIYLAILLVVLTNLTIRLVGCTRNNLEAFES